MRNVVLAILGVTLLLSSCGTYTGQGAYAGATIGSVLGSAIGGISGGTWRSRDLGSIVGMAGGAAVGAAIGAAADQKRAEDLEQYRRDRAARRPASTYDDSGFDSSNSGDDRINFDAPGPSGSQSIDIQQIENLDRIEVVNARFVDANHDGVLRAGEECRIMFEVMNRSRHTVYDVQPLVYELTGNKHIRISPNLRVESIAPNSGVRYTATILGDRRLKDGTVVIRCGVTKGGGESAAHEQELTVPTRRR